MSLGKAKLLFSLHFLLGGIILIVAETTVADTPVRNPASPLACTGACGDANGNGIRSLTDVVTMFNYCLNVPGGPFGGLWLDSCGLEQGDVDLFADITVRDVCRLTSYIFSTAPFDTVPVCPDTLPSYTTSLEADDTLELPGPILVPASFVAQSVVLTLNYKNTDTLYALSLPIQVSVGGGVPEIDTVIFSSRIDSATIEAYRIDTAQGKILIGAHWFFGLLAGSGVLADIYLVVPPDSLDRIVQVDTTTFIPSNYPMFVKRPGLQGVVPTLIGFGPAPIIFQAFSPVDLIVTDPAGDSITKTVGTIPGANYAAVNDSIFIPAGLPGEYKVKVVRDPFDPDPDTTYSISVRIDGKDQAIVASNVPAPQVGEVDTFAVEYGTPCATPGDATGNGTLNLADVIAAVNYVFNKSGYPPCPANSALCWLSGQLCQGDWNGNGIVQLQDVIFGVNFAFNKPGNWTPVSTAGCCVVLP